MYITLLIYIYIGIYVGFISTFGEESLFNSGFNPLLEVQEVRRELVNYYIEHIVIRPNNASQPLPVVSIHAGSPELARNATATASLLLATLPTCCCCCHCASYC